MHGTFRSKCEEDTFGGVRDSETVTLVKTIPTPINAGVVEHHRLGGGAGLMFMRLPMPSDLEMS